MAPSKGGVLKKHFELVCRPKTRLYSGITRQAGIAGVRTQGRLVVDIALYPPPEGKGGAAKKR